jgi:hypothetical protein
MAQLPHLLETGTPLDAGTQSIRATARPYPRDVLLVSGYRGSTERRVMVELALEKSAPATSRCPGAWQPPGGGDHMTKRTCSIEGCEEINDTQHAYLMDSRCSV